MEIYLPIAEMAVNVLVLLGLGAGVGMLAGVFGVGGGFLLTPLLILLGIPPLVAVGTQAPQILASSFSGMLAHLRRGGVDIRMGLVLVAGGAVGTVLGVLLFGWLRRMGQVDLVVGALYVLLLGVVGALMLVEGVQALRRTRRRGGPARRIRRRSWLDGLPLRMRFPASRLYISVYVPLATGFVVGLLAALMGVGGAFVMLPAMIYLIGMPSAVVVGTSLFQICFVTALATLLHAVHNVSVDIVLALLLIVGGVVGAQIGARLGARLPGEQMRVLMAALVLLVAGRLLYELIAPPPDPYSIAR